MISSAIADKQWHKAAAKDLVFQNETEPAQKLRLDVEDAVRAGHSSKQIRAELVQRGIPGDWARVIVNAAFSRDWQEALAQANADVDEGKTDTDAIKKAINFARAKVTEDPTLKTIPTRLRGQGYSEKLAEFVTSHPELRAERTSSAMAWVFGGILFMGFGMWAYSASAPADEARNKIPIFLVIGAWLILKGAWNALRSSLSMHRR